jgi:predicted deacetylase
LENSIYYLIRLDDACSTMNKAKWARIEKILDQYSIKPMVGITPNNKDVTLKIEAPDVSFWEIARKWQEKGWAIALHGYEHIYLNKNGDVSSSHTGSEFAGLSINEQGEKIEKGLSILQEQMLDVNYFFAPNHTFDENTLKALHLKSSIKKISDTFARFPYIRENFIFYPQQFGNFRNIKIKGYWTFCFHPNTMDDKSLYDFEIFIKQNYKNFISFDSIDMLTLKPKRLTDKILASMYLIYKHLSRLLNRFHVHVPKSK